MLRHTGKKSILLTSQEYLLVTFYHQPERQCAELPNDLVITGRNPSPCIDKLHAPAQQDLLLHPPVFYLARTPAGVFLVQGQQPCRVDDLVGPVINDCLLYRHHRHFFLAG